MISPDEQLVPLTDAARHVPDGAPRPHASTCIRWALRGVGTPKVRLETVKVGGRRFTSPGAVRRFIAQLSAPAAAPAAAGPDRRRQVDRADAELDAEGFRPTASPGA